MVRVCCGIVAVYHSCSLCCRDALNAPFCIYHPMYLRQLTLEQPVEFFMSVRMTLFTLHYHLCTALHIKFRDVYFCYRNVDLFISSLIPPNRKEIIHQTELEAVELPHGRAGFLLALLSNLVDLMEPFNEIKP